MLTHIRLERFTAFEQLDLELNPGINVFIGANGTGKTHLLKVAYAVCDITKTGMDFAEKLTRVFYPRDVSSVGWSSVSREGRWESSN